MPLPISERSINKIISALSQITIANGYQTNAGENVFRSIRTIDQECLPAINVWEDGEEAEKADGSNTSMVITLTLSIDGHVKINQSDTGKVIGLLKSDIKKAILKNVVDNERSLMDEEGKIGIVIYSRTDSSARQDGAATEAVSVKFNIRFTEKYGDPYSNK